MGLIEELTWRGLVSQVTHPELAEELEQGPMTLYAGFDPTADSLHVGMHGIGGAAGGAVAKVPGPGEHGTALGGHGVVCKFYAQRSATFARRCSKYRLRGFDYRWYTT